MFFRIGNERFNMSSVSRYRADGRSIYTEQWYVTVWFGAKERRFPFGTEKDMNDMIDYLDSIFKVSVI